MKKIEEARRGLPENRGVLMSSLQLIAEVSFESGVAFAQRWIPVEDELPEIGDQVIVKNEHRKEIRKISSIYDIKDITEFATHWRPIELE